MIRRTISVAIAAGLALTACAGGSDDASTSTVGTNTTGSATATSVDGASIASSTISDGSSTSSTSSTAAATGSSTTPTSNSTTTTAAGNGGGSATTTTTPPPPTAPPGAGSLYLQLRTYFYDLLADASATDGVTYVADEDCVARVLGQYSDADAAIILATPFDDDPQLSDAGENLSNEINRCIDIADPSNPRPPGSTAPATTAVPDPNVPIQQQAGDVMVASFAKSVADGEFGSFDEACVRQVAARFSNDDATKVVTFGIEEDPGLSDDGLDIFYDVVDCIEF